MNRFPKALSGLPQAVVIVDTAGTIRAGNSRIESVVGYTPSELEGTDLHRLVYDTDDGSAGEQLRRYVSEPDPRSVAANIDLTVQTKNGREIPVTVSLGPFDQDGKTFLVVTIVDIGEQRAEQDRLHRRTETLHGLQESTQELLKTTDRSVTAEKAIDCVKTVLGHDIAGLWLYKPADDALHPVVWTELADEIVGDHPTFSAETPSISWNVFESGEPEYVSDTRSDPDRYNPDSPIKSELLLPLGRYGVINIGATEPDSFTESDLALARLWAATVTMVLMRIERERQLRAREDEIARERDRLEEFASLVSHDLRNPLNVATGNLDLVRSRLEDDHEELPELNALARSLHRMGVLIDDMLTLAKQGSEIDETELVSLSELAQECWESVETAEATIVVVDDVWLKADRSRLRQALENLFANAVAHGGRSVHVTVGRLDESSGFYVADDGNGIGEEVRDELFDAGISTDPDGTGFGLKIVAEVAEAHGWEVSVTDSESGGARFEFRGIVLEEPPS